jgi:hypothetical protein
MASPLRNGLFGIPEARVKNLDDILILAVSVACFGFSFASPGWKDAGLESMYGK